MAEMSQDEKRAAGWRKLKKYQQHKTVSSSSKTMKKKQDYCNENQEAFSLFTGFAESAKNGIEEHSNGSVVITQSTEQVLSSSELSVNKPSEEYPGLDEEGRLTDQSVNIVHNITNVTIQPSTMQVTIPVSAHIFSSSYSSDANNCSDFFDNLKSSIDQSNENVFSHTRSNGPTDLIDKQCKVESSSKEDQSTTFASVNALTTEEEIEQKSSVSETDCHSQIDFPSSIIRAEREDNSINKEQVSSIDAAQSVLPTNLASSAESLRQLSLELSGLIDESVSASGPSSTEMERRNQELAALLASEQQKSEKLQLQMKEYESRVTQLQIEASQHQTEQLARLQRELSAAQEQLQLHVQTVGILVGEKAELEAGLSKSQQTAKQKAAEVEELQGRLKASRHRVTDLERELSVTASGSKHFESTLQQQSKELSRMKLEKEMLTKQVEEVEEEVAELRQNLDVRSNEVQNLQQQLQERQSQLDLAQLRVQQLSLSETTDMERQLESLHQQKVGLERQVSELQQTVQALGSERDQANTQYQEYLHHVNGHLKSMADKLAAATAENEQLSNREQSLVKHLSELEKQLQQQQNQRNRVKDSPSHIANTEHIQQLEQNIRILEEDKGKLTVDMDTQLQENKVLQDQLETYVTKVEELENMVESLKADQPDTHKLLAAMESDKVAASRAVGQNQKLKEQLEELQEGFIQMSNNKLELTEQLQKEQHVSKELGERLAQQELEISELRSQLVENEKIVENFQTASSEQMSRQMLKEDQIADQMRHYEAQGYLNEALQSELHQSKELCSNLHVENDDLRMKLANVKDTRAIESAGEDLSDEVVNSLKASVHQLTLERDQLLSQLQEVKPHKSTSTDPPAYSTPSQDMDVKEYDNMKDAMEKLQARFARTMDEIAEISDEKQRLEHLVLQLQGETETIGEYIALYQTQRIMLRQRAQEKDEQLARLARDREEVKIKLNELNRLIGQLVTENGNKMSTTILSPQSSDIKSTIEEKLPTSEGLINGDVSMKQQVVSDGNDDIDLRHDIVHSETNAVKTADKIIALISEIETSTLVEPRSIENFHPCPWCSGRLITV